MRYCKLLPIVLATTFGCGSGATDERDDDPKPATYTVGGVVSGLSGTLVLQNNGADDLSVTSDGAFVFATPLAAGAAYAVTVLAQPDDQICSVAGGGGAIGAAAVTSVAVTCVTLTQSIGGSVTGLLGTLVLANNGGDDLTLTDNGDFTFATELPRGATYSVAVATQPSGQTCEVAAASGLVGAADVTSVEVTCSTNTHEVGGTVDGLDGSLLLQLNGGDDLLITGDGPFTFSTTLFDGDDFEVTIASPSKAQRCSITGGSGQDVLTDVSSVQVDCVDMAWLLPSGVDDTVSPEAGDVEQRGRRVVMNSFGEAAVVWTQREGTEIYVFASRFVDGGWVHPTSTADRLNPAGQGENADVAIDEDGNVIVVWDQWDGSGSRIYMAEYRDGAWDKPADLNDRINPGTSIFAHYPKVAAAANGEAVIVWREYNANTTCSVSGCGQMLKSEYRGGSWTHPATVAAAISRDGTHVEQDAYAVAMADNGDTVVVWHQYDGSTTCGDGSGECVKLFKAEYRGGMWSVPASLADHWGASGHSTSDARVAMASTGEALVLWVEHDDTTDCSGWPCRLVHKSEYREGAWDDATARATAISPAGVDCFELDAALAANGDAVIVWISEPSDRRGYLSERRGGVWSYPTDADDHVTPSGSTYGVWEALRVAMDDDGYTALVFDMDDASTDCGAVGDCGRVFFGRYHQGAWELPASASESLWHAGSGVYSSVYRPQVAVGGNGEVVIASQHSDGAGEAMIVLHYR